MYRGSPTSTVSTSTNFSAVGIKFVLSGDPLYKEYTIKPEINQNLHCANHQNLTATTKVKNGKKSQFTLTRRSRTKSATKGDIDFEDLVCPFSDNSDQIQNLSSDDSTAK